MTGTLNGDSPKALTINVTLTPEPGGGELVYVRSDGVYLGRIHFKASNAEAVGIIGNMFQQWAQQQSGANSIQVATSVNLPNLRS